MPMFLSTERIYPPPPLPPIYRLSQELIDEIIDVIHFLAEEKWWADRWDFLSNCALVCRAFLPRSQMHLFTHINLPGTHQSRWVKEGDYSRVSRLLEIVENRPLVAHHIQKLSIYLPEGNTSWLYRNPDMSKLLQKVNATPCPLRHLLLSSEPALSPLKTSAYNTGFPPLYHFFKDGFAPYITSLHLEFIFGVPVELVTMCTHLRDLSLRYTTFAFQDPNILGFLDQDTGQHLNRPVDWALRPKIRFLEYKLLEDDYVIKPDTSLSKLLTDRSFLDFSDLQTLTTFTDEPVRNLDLAQRIVDASKGSLEDVIIEMYNHELQLDSIPSTFLNLENHRDLQSLSSIAFFQTPDSIRSEFSGISHTCKTLMKISSSDEVSSLRRFDLVLAVYPYAEEYFLCDVGWDTFCEEMTRISTLSTRYVVTGERKLALTLYMHYHALSVSSGVPWSATEPEDIERHVEGVMEKLVRDRLTSLRVRASVILSWHTVVVKAEE